MNDIVGIFKNTGTTSFDAVGIIKKATETEKVGHTGTLGPEASGVSPICTSEGTKIIDYTTNSGKIYEVEFRLGIKTTTYDLEEDIIEERGPSNIGDEDILKTIYSFEKEYSQVLPMYSALKQNSVRLYKLTRKGIEVEGESELISIHKIEGVRIDNPYISMRAICSKGTYIRGLCYDIGGALSVGATMTELKRGGTSKFTEDESINIKDINSENIKDYIISIEGALDPYRKLVVLSRFSKLLTSGVKVFDKRLTKEDIEVGKLYKVYDDSGIFIGLDKSGRQGFKIEKLLIN